MHDGFGKKKLKEIPQKVNKKKGKNMQFNIHIDNLTNSVHAIVNKLCAHTSPNKVLH